MNKLTIPVSDLKAALPGFSKVIPKRVILPVLGCVLFHTNKQGQLQLTATDLEDYVSRSLSVIDDDGFTALIPFEPLNRLLKGCASESTLCIELVKNEARITYSMAGTTFLERVTCLAVTEFPEVPHAKWIETITVGSDFKEAVLQAFDSVGNDCNRFILNHAFIDVSDPDAHYIVGTSGKEMFTANSFKLDLKESTIIPKGKFLLWKGFMDDGDWTISLGPKPVEDEKRKAPPSWIKVESAGWTLITKQIEGQYPNWRSPIPRQETAKAIVYLTPEASKFVINAAPRLPGSDDTNKPIALTTKGNAVLLSGADGETSVPIVAATAKGVDTSMRMNREYLVKAMKLGLTTAEIHNDAEPVPIVVFRTEGKRLIVAGLKQDESEPTTTETSQTETSETPAPVPSASPVPESQPSEEPKEEMKTINRVENVPTETVSNGGNPGPAPAAAFDQVRLQMETIKDKLKGVVSDLTDALKLLAQAQRERRASEKEIEEVRETLQSLQKIRI